MNWKKVFIGIGILGIVQFLVLTTVAMKYYPGGILHDRTTIGYSFYTNFFSDLGRTVALNRELNTVSHLLFKTAMTCTGISMVFFFSTVPFLFKNKGGKALASIAMLAGFGAAVCYVGIAWNPLNGSYWTHRFFVRTGFIAFLLCIIFYVAAIRSDANYPNIFATILLTFGLVLLAQIAIMLLGPRSWQSADALWLQVVAQKVIVYGEILCMLVQTIGAYQLVRKLE